MIRHNDGSQRELEFISIEELVPPDHLLRQIDSRIDFSFVRDRLYPLYCSDNGRPAVDPEVLFRMVFIGYLYGIRSERELIRQIEVNVAYRWFLGYGLRDKIPHHSTISQNRRRRFEGTDVFRELFEDVVVLAIKAGYVTGESLYTDSTHLKANANKHKFKKKRVRANVRKYLEELDDSINADRKSRGKKEFPPREDDPPEKDIKQSTTDSDSGFMTREGKPRGFYYLDHRTCDGMHNLITDVHLTPASISDSLVYPERLDYQCDRFGFDVEEVGVDAGYNTPNICRELVKRGIFGVVGYQKPGGKRGLFRKSRFTYDSESDSYLCPEGHRLKYSTTTRRGFCQYASNPHICKNCSRLTECTHSRIHRKVITRHVWEKYKEEISNNRTSDRGKAIKQRRRETVERSFADAKELHGYRYARFRGRKRVEEQCLMTAIVQNIKKIATLLGKSPDNPLKTCKNHLLKYLNRIFESINPPESYTLKT